MEATIILLRYLVLYIIIISGSAFISYKTNKKIEYTLPINFGITILVLYIFGLFEGLKYGVYVIAILNLILGIYTIIKNWKNKEKIKEKILTPGFAFFTIVFFVLMITTYSKNLVDYDHYFYRSFNAKTMFYTDTMSRGYKELYHPGITLIEYFFMKIIGVYIQGVEAFAVQLFGFALLLPLFDRIDKSKFMNTIITIVVICVPAVFANLIFYEGAYPDALLGLLIGYSVYMLCVEKDNKFKTLSIVIALMVATILKPIGFYISGIVIGMYLLVALFNYKSIKKFFKSKELKNIIIFLLAIIIMFLSWTMFTKINNKYNDGTRGNDNARVEGNPIGYVLKSIATTMFGYYEESYDSAYSNNELIPKVYSLYSTVGIVRLTLYGCIAVLMLSAILTYKYVIKNENKEQYKNWIIALTIGLAVYLLFLQICYIVKFSTEEMLDHAGLNRYLPTFLLGMLYFIVALSIKNMEEKNDRKVNYLLLIAIIISFTSLQSIANVSITSGIYNMNSIRYTKEGREPAKEIEEKVEEDAQIIGISMNKDKDIFNWMIKYYLCPNHKVDVYNELTEKTIEAMKEKILENDVNYYIYIVSTEIAQKILLKEGLGIQTNLKEGTLYKVQKQQDNIILEER